MLSDEKAAVDTSVRFQEFEGVCMSKINACEVCIEYNTNLRELNGGG